MCGGSLVAALHAHDELFSKHIEPEPPPEDPVDLAMAEASDDEDDAPMPDARLEPEIIDMPPAPASALPMSNLERCIALRLVATRRSHRQKKIALASYHIVSLMSHVSVVLVLCVLPRLPDSDITVTVFFLTMASIKC